MERIEYKTIDKSGWERGQWDDEPDKIQWPDEATGLPCLIVRGPHGGLCGYVGVPESHPMHGLGYDEGHAGEIEVHGGLTFAARCQPHAKEDHGICHKPGPGESDHVWWFGFDCAHFMDISPAYDRHRRISDETSIYRDVRYVTEECRKLAAQLAKIAH